jgi:hypothetical protein
VADCCDAKCRYWPEAVAPTGRVRVRYQGYSGRARVAVSRRFMTLFDRRGGSPARSLSGKNGNRVGLKKNDVLDP